MKINNHILAFLTLSTLARSLIAQEPVGDRYVFHEIVIPGLSNISANAINNSGTLVGTSDSGPFVLGHGQLETISIAGATFVEPSGVNNLGQMVGSYYDEQNYQRPFLRERDGRVTILPWGPTGENPGGANGINVLGTIVGDSFAIDTNGFQTTGSAIISDRRQMLYFDLEAPGVLITRLRGINARGDMVGQATLNETFASGGFFAFKSAAFVVDDDGARVIDTPWPWVTAHGINAQNTIVGEYIAAPGRVAEHHGFVLTDGTMTTVDLTSTTEWPAFIMADDIERGTLRFNLVAVGTSIKGINDRGQVVAVSFARYLNRTFFIDVTYRRAYVGTPIRSQLTGTMNPGS